MTVTRETPASRQWPEEVAAMGTAAPVQRRLGAEVAESGPRTGLQTGHERGGLNPVGGEFDGVPESGDPFGAADDVEAAGTGLPPEFDRVWMRVFFGVVVVSTLAIGGGWYLMPHKHGAVPAMPGPSAEAPKAAASVVAATAVPGAMEKVASAPAAAVAPVVPLVVAPVLPLVGAPVVAPVGASGVGAVPAEVPDDRTVPEIVAEMTSPEDLVVAAAHKMAQGDPLSVLQLLLRGDELGWAPASLQLGRMYDPGLPHPFDVPSPDMGYAIERYIRAKKASDPATVRAAQTRLDAIRAGLRKNQAKDPAAAALLGKYFP